MRKESVSITDGESIIEKKELAMKNFLSYVKSTKSYLLDNYEDFNYNEKLREASTKFYNFLEWILSEDRTLEDYETIKEKYNEVNKDGSIEKYFGYFKVILSTIEDWSNQVDKAAKRLREKIIRDNGLCQPYKIPVQECVNCNSYGIICLECSSCGRKF